LKWLKDIFHIKKSSDNAQNLALSEVYSWLKVQSEPSGFEDRLQDIYVSIEEAAQALARDLRALGSPSLIEQLHQSFCVQGLQHVARCSSRWRRWSRGWARPQEETSIPPRITTGSWSKGWRGQSRPLAGRQRYAAALFPKEIESINAELSRISHLLVELEGVIGQRRAELEEIWYARELADSINEGMSLIAGLKERAKKKKRSCQVSNHP